jgi:hypothetical protein
MSVSAKGPLQKINEDPRLRPFLSSVFDAQSYTRTVIKEGRSEESFANIVTLIEEINMEIKGYISQHKESLMSGMQEVASLAERYNNLSANSQKFQRNIAKMKKDAMESHNLVASRTLELERIHETAILLHQLKQFVQSKAQLDQYLKDHNAKDVRNLSAAAKTVNELETLLGNQKLLEIKLVADCASTIKLFGQNIRLLAQDKLLTAITEKNQASIASCLQVFYNLRTLPEVIILVIDTAVKRTAEASRESLHLEFLNGMSADLLLADPTLNIAGSATTMSHSSSSSSSLASRSASSANIGAVAIGALTDAAGSALANVGGTSVSSSSTHQVTTLAQLRIAIREIAHMWSGCIYDHAMQVHVLQRVVNKKEDPVSHERFLDVLCDHCSAVPSSGGKNGTQPSAMMQFLARGQLLDVFWDRLVIALSEVAAEKLKSHPLAASRAYPSLRRAAVDVVRTLKDLTGSEMVRDLSSTASSTFPVSKEFTEYISHLYTSTAMDDYCEEENERSSSKNKDDPYTSKTDHNDLDDGDLFSEAELARIRSADTGYMFGSLQWSQVDLLRSACPRGGVVGQRSRHAMQHFLGSSHRGGGGRKLRGDMTISSSGSIIVSGNNGANGGWAEPLSGLHSRERDAHRGEGVGYSEETGLLAGFKPIRDRFLINVLNRMNAPIFQMFPELDGYTAAVPSKRDLQAFIKALQLELVIAATESDTGLISCICREFLKAVQLMLSKIEGMVISGPETRKLSSQNNFLRTSKQEHNGQLLVLLLQFQDALEKIHSNVTKQSEEALSSGNMLSSALSSMGAGGTGMSEQQSEKQRLESVSFEIHKVVRVATRSIRQIGSTQILDPIVDLLSGYVKSVLLGLLKEGFVSKPASRPTPAKFGAIAVGGPMDVSSMDCSIAVQTLLKQVGLMVSQHITSLPPSPVVDAALQELSIRIMHSYVTVAALSRPVTELGRLRAAKDLSSLEELLRGVYSFTQAQSDACPVIQEFKAFRRLLFLDSDLSVSAEKSSKKSYAAAAQSAEAPRLSQLLTLPYFRHLRPSTLLGHLVSCGPSLLPSPYDAGTAAGASGATGMQAQTAYIESLTELLLVAPMSGASSLSASQPSSSIRSLYIPITTTGAASSSNNSSGSWRVVRNEIASWECFQTSLDTFSQRILVMEGVEKQQMRGWYESIAEIGSWYFESH